MNKIYKVIWSKTRNCYMAVAEFVKRQGKSSSGLNRRHIGAALGNKTAASLLAAVAICAAPAGALANSGGHLEGITYIGDAPDYKVIIDSDTNGHVYGRRESGTIAVSGASVTVTSGTVGNLPYTGNVYGGYSQSGNAENNTVILSKEEGKEAPVLKGTLYGGYSVGGSVTKNEVTVNGGEVKSYVQGGYSHSGNAENNTVTVSGGTVVGVSGGRSLRANAGNNTVTIRGGTVGNLPYTGNVYGGGSASDGDAISNTVTIAGGTINGHVYGGYSSSGNAENNTVILSREKEAPVLNGTLFGGLSDGGGTVSGNTLTITGGKATAAFGGRATTGDVTGNKVTMSGGEIVRGSTSGFYAGNLYGGLAENGVAAGNEVTISGGTLGRFTYVFGGRSEQGAAGGTDPKDGNKVTITGGTVGTVQGGYSRLDASYNSVVIAGGTVQGIAYGGQSTQGNALNNSVTVKEGTAGGVFGGYTSLTGMKAAGNKVTITGGTVWDVYGGWVEDTDENGDSVGGSSNPASATENTVEIRGGTVKYDVYGGRSMLGPAERNTVILAKEGKEAPVINGTLYGGVGGSVKNNTLQVEAVGLSAPEIRNFDNFRFILPTDIKAGDRMLELNRQGENLTIDGSKVDVSMGGGTIADIGLTLDESVTLLHKTGGSGAFSVNNSNKAVYTKTLDDAAGGLPEDIYSLTASEDKLNVTYTERYLYGDGGTNTTGQRETGNTLIIADGEKASAAFGGRATSGDVTGNKVIMSGGEIVDRGVIQIGSVYVSGNLYGGFADTGNAVKNAVELSGGTVAYDVYGGYSEQGNVEKNTVTITGGTADNDVYGGYSEQGNVEKNTVTITGGTVKYDVVGGYSYSGNAENNTVTISGGTVEDDVYGGDSDSGDVTGNTVTISGGTVEDNVVGGYSYSGNAENNTVTISGGTVKYDVVGGYSYSGNAENNTVTISGGTVEGTVYGGYSDTRNGNATGNKVILSKQEGGTAPVISGTLFGGFSYDGGTVSNNTLQVEAVGLSAPEIQNFENYRFVLPSDTEANDTLLTLKNQSVELEIDANKVDMGVAKGGGLNVDFGESITLLHKAGGEGAFSVKNLTGAVQTSKLDGVSTGFDVMKYTLDKPANEDKLNVTVSELWLYGDGGTNTKGRREKDNTLTINSGKAMAAFGGRATSGDVTGNKVEMSGGELVQLSDSSDPDYNVSGNLYGGYTDAGNVQGNTVEMSGGKVESSLYGGYTKSGMAGGDKPEHGNKVSMTGGEANNITGGSTDDGAAGYNTVSVSNAKVAHATGGATLEGDAVGNTVTLTNTELSYKVTGGDVYRGRAAENTVTIDGGSVGMNVFGGVSISGNVENNTVSIRSGKINGVLDGLKTGLTGGYGSERVVGNTVAITGGELFVESVYGGYHTSRSGSGLAEKNVVTLGGGTYDAGLNVIGGGSNNEANDNAVNLTGTTKGLEGAKLYGWKETEDGATVTGTGNELHVGGTKTYDKNGSATIAKGSWQGMDVNGKHTNQVDSVSNFDSIVLHNVVWGDTPALAAKEIKNIGGLDVTGLEFFTHPDNSTVHEHALKDYMVLLHADNNELTGMEITYLDEGNVKTEALTGQGINYHKADHHSEENGVTVDGSEVKRIYLAEDKKSVDFFYHVDGTKIALGNVEFVKDGTARILDGRFDVRNATIDAGSLPMTEASLEKAAAGETMTVLDAEDAIKTTGETATLKAFTGEGVTGGVKQYDVKFTDALQGDGAGNSNATLTISGIHTDTLAQNAERNRLTYTVGEKKVREVALAGAIDWNSGGVTGWSDGVTAYADRDYQFNTDVKIDMRGLSINRAAVDPQGQSMTLVSGKAAGTVENAPASFGVSLAGANTTLDATAEGAAAVANGDVTYAVTGVTLDKVTVNQVTAGTDSVPKGWAIASGLEIDTDTMQLPTGTANSKYAILTAGSGSFAGANVTGQYAYASHSPFTLKNGGVAVAGEKKGGVKLSDDNKSVEYHVVQDHVKNVALGPVEFAKDKTLLTVGGEYEFTKVNAINTTDFAMNYAKPETVAARESMTLLQGNSTLQANALLANMAADVKTKNYSYSFEPVAGVNVAAKITGSLGTTAKGDGFTYTVNENRADKLTFGSVEWKHSGALLKRPDNIIFAGAVVDTTQIHFHNVDSLKTDHHMTLVSDFGDTVGQISGDHYTVGSTLQGKGSASLKGSDLVYTVEHGTHQDTEAQPQTHNTVMGMTAGISLLASGAEQISQAMAGLNLMDSFGGMNTAGGAATGTTGTGGTGGSGQGSGAGSGSDSGTGQAGGTEGSEASGQGQDGTGSENTGGENNGSDPAKGEEGQKDENGQGSGKASGGRDDEQKETDAEGIIIASIGGSKDRVETGSHVTSHNWNGVLGIGGKRMMKSGTLQYAAFAEHGRSNFTLHSENGRGSGNSRYTGGGLIAKWQNRHNVYMEASIRAGRMHDTASNMLHDPLTGQGYGYDVRANYIGGHVGVGKVYYYENGRSLDVYGRFFHMKRDGVSFDAGGHFDLDSVKSSVLRVGARYGATDKLWNWYGGLAYEYEFDGKSTGTADGAPIRSASMSGGSVRGEIGLRMNSGRTNPWKADISLTAHAGKHRGFGGNVSVAYTF